MNSVYTKYPWPTLFGGSLGAAFVIGWMFSYGKYQNHFLSDDGLNNLLFSIVCGLVIALGAGTWSYFYQRRLCNFALIHFVWPDISRELDFVSDSKMVIKPNRLKTKIKNDKVILTFSNAYGGVLTNSAAKSVARLESVAVALQHRLRFESVYIDRDMPGYVRLIFSDDVGGL